MKTNTKLVSWSLTYLFSTNTAIYERRKRTQKIVTERNIKFTERKKSKLRRDEQGIVSEATDQWRRILEACVRPCTAMPLQRVAVNLFAYVAEITSRRHFVFTLRTGVASYGALGHVSPRLPAVYFFQLILELHKVWQRLCIASANILYSATAAAVVQSRLCMNLAQCII